MANKIHRAYFNGHKGYYNPKTGNLKFGSKVFRNIGAAIKYLNSK